MEEFKSYDTFQPLMDFIRTVPENAKERQIILFLIDGLGRTDLNLKFLERKVYRTVFPSSTPTFMYSFHSLKEPQEHGYLEWYMRLKVGTDEFIMEIPPWRPVNQSEDKINEKMLKRLVFPFKPLSKMMSERGLSSCYYTPYPDSIFTKMTSKGAKVVGIRQLSEVFPLEDADFTYIYWDGLDRVLHRSSNRDAIRTEIGMLRVFIKYLWKKFLQTWN